MSSLAENFEGHLNSNDLKPVYRALKKLCSKSNVPVPFNTCLNSGKKRLIYAI